MTQNNSKQRTHVKHMNERMNARAPSPDVHRQKHKSSKRGAQNQENFAFAFKAEYIGH